MNNSLQRLFKPFIEKLEARFAALFQTLYGTIFAIFSGGALFFISGAVIQASFSAKRNLPFVQRWTGEEFFEFLAFTAVFLLVFAPVLLFVHFQFRSKRQRDDLIYFQKQLFGSLTDRISILVWACRSSGDFYYFNDPWLSFRGKTLDEESRQGWLSGLHPDDRSTWESVFRSALQQKAPFQIEFRLLRKNGTYTWFSNEGVPLFNEEGSFTGFTGACIDISDRRETEQDLRLAANVFTHAKEGIIITDTEGNIIDLNDAFVSITGYSRKDAVGSNPRILKSGVHDRSFYERMWSQLRGSGEWSGEIWNRHKNGQLYAEHLTISAVPDEKGEPQYFTGIFTDITAYKEYQKQLENIAHYDPLTGLPNRVLLGDRLSQAIAHADRRKQRLTIAYIDLDGFKEINDSHGHQNGDYLLSVIADRMKQALRAGDTIARIGGDEFVAVLIDMDSSRSSIALLNRILAAVSSPVFLSNELEMQVSASIGVTFYPQNDCQEADQLLRQADHAMYQAKVAGKNRYFFFDTEEERSIRGLYETQESIKRAIQNHEFVLYYQPRVNMQSGTVVSYEALIRWNHPTRGLLYPDQFLSFVEEQPAGVDLGEWVIRTALSQLVQWKDAGFYRRISINISGHHLQQPDFVERLKEILLDFPGVAHNDIELEILESSALKDIERVSTVMRQCREFGIEFSLDDFGTGYSSLTYLKRLPISRLKIDRSFVMNMLENSDDLAILEGVMGFSGAFRLETIAEGVEDETHGEILIQLGCQYAQGFGIARPMPADSILEWEQTWKPFKSWEITRTVSKDDLPALFAGVEHRSWVRALELYLDGGLETLPPMKEKECRFGRWYYGEGNYRYRNEPGYAEIEALHKKVHSLGIEIAELKARGETDLSRHSLDQLKELSKELIGNVQRLTRSLSVR